MAAELLAELAALAALPGPSGEEHAVAAHLLGALRAGGPPARLDAMGNVVACAAERPRGLVCAHLDQVSFMVSRVEDDRAVCLPVGEPELGEPADVRVVARGVSKATGRLEPTGAQNGSALLTCDRAIAVEVGDRVVFAGSLEDGGDGTVRGCALDDRIGCWVVLRAALELAAQRPDVAFVWTVREEIDAAGVLHAARALEPEWVVCVDVTPADEDRADTGESDVVTGGGPAVTLLDDGMVVDAVLLDAFTIAAGAAGVEFQREVVAEGISEAGAVQGALGIPSLALLVPVEGEHTPAETAHVRDIEHARALLAAALPSLDRR